MTPVWSLCNFFLKPVLRIEGWNLTKKLSLLINARHFGGRGVNFSLFFSKSCPTTFIKKKNCMPTFPIFDCAIFFSFGNWKKKKIIANYFLLWTLTLLAYSCTITMQQHQKKKYYKRQPTTKKTTYTLNRSKLYIFELIKMSGLKKKKCFSIEKSVYYKISKIRIFFLEMFKNFYNLWTYNLYCALMDRRRFLWTFFGPKMLFFEGEEKKTP